MVILILELILIGLSLSMDALALSVSINSSGLVDTSQYKKYGLFVGIYHFFMPLIGYIIKIMTNKVITVPSKELFCLIIVFIMFGIILDKQTHVINKFINPLLFGFMVSVDSLSIGIGLSYKEIILGPVLFMIISGVITYFGFLLSSSFMDNIKNKRKIISILILSMVLLIKLIN